MVLNQRSAILRSLCGMSLHNGMDNSSTGPYLLGGYSAISAASRSLEVSTMLSNTASWMSVAKSLRDRATDVLKLGKDLDGVLLHSAFLFGPSVPQPTLADFDVFFALTTAFTKQSPSEKNSTLAHTNPNLQRWINQRAAKVQRLFNAVHRVPSQNDLPNVSFSDIVQQRLGMVDIVSESAPNFVYAPIDSSIPNTPSLPSVPTHRSTTNETPTGPKSSSEASSPPSAADAALEEKKKKAAEKKAAKKAAKDAKNPTPTTPTTPTMNHRPNPHPHPNTTFLHSTFALVKFSRSKPTNLWRNYGLNPWMWVRNNLDRFFPVLGDISPWNKWRNRVMRSSVAISERGSWRVYPPTVWFCALVVRTSPKCSLWFRREEKVSK